ncbi:pleiotropic drug resistance protein 3-like [Gossypium australe]|uniref:Pleiotropic drug resistance protein 3-like n=1 Tax=Gossypium australe TaxID=47621 RepID=A0A5B6UZM7_9ROSI|nr:pleiotropic drug resistance protein 3-like [Gossypium australe]
MSRTDLVENMDRIEDQNGVYEARLLFPANKAWRANEKFHLVHSDVCRPMKTFFEWQQILYLIY